MPNLTCVVRMADLLMGSQQRARQFTNKLDATGNGELANFQRRAMK